MLLLVDEKPNPTFSNSYEILISIRNQTISNDYFDELSHTFAVDVMWLLTSLQRHTNQDIMCYTLAK